MKKLFVFLSLVISVVGFAQSGKPATSNCEVCVDYSFTSISQLEDVKETDAFYIHLQSLVERYGVNVAACNKTTFGGSKILTNAALVQMLSSSLLRIDELKEIVIKDKTEADKTKILAKIKFHSFDFYKHNYSSVKQVKDVSVMDCFYSDVEALLEKYEIDVTNKAGLLQASKPADGKNLGILLIKVFGLKNFDIKKYNKANITKAEFATMLNEALDEYNEMIAAAAYD
jgi:hypothetical protein